MPNTLEPFLSGAVTMGFGLSGLAFLRLWRRSGDHLLLAFAGAFWLLMVQPLSMLGPISHDSESWFYLFRLAAYVLIITAVLVKNRNRLGRLAGRNGSNGPQ